MVIPLSYLEQGQKAQIVWMAFPPKLGCHLQDLGFDADQPVTCVQKGRGGGMSAYLIGRRIVALRVSEALNILVRLSPARSPAAAPPGPRVPDRQLPPNDRSENASCRSGRKGQ